MFQYLKGHFNKIVYFWLICIFRHFMNGRAELLYKMRGIKEMIFRKGCAFV